MPVSSPRGLVVTYDTEGARNGRGHEWSTQTEIARRLAALKGFDFAGEHDGTTRRASRPYFVPNNTLTLEMAHRLDIHDQDDLFGGVVPHAFVATKAITHPLVAADADAPQGWSHEFGRRVRDIVHSGYCVFTLDDARRAGERLLANGPLRVKPVRAAGGLGQVVVERLAELPPALAKVDMSDLKACGLVLEENLVDVVTYSVGRVSAAGLLVSYCGSQRLTPDNRGTMVYGGSELLVARGGFDALLALDWPEDCRLAVDQARLYDAAVRDCFPGLFASRRNYDVALGRNAVGRRRSGVLEQSWRIGGASGAEIAALEALHADPQLRAIRAECREIYGDQDALPPADATVYFRDTDRRAGPLTKYSRIERHGDAR